MRFIISTIALLTVIVLSGSNLNAATSDETTVKFSVEKMTCATCPISVRKAMERVDGVKNVEVNLETKMATVIYDSRVTTASDISNASTDVGFPATEVVEE
ncbi:MAG: mercuric ion binding protein [Candidatus Azotimanducaceae bacterium]|jgi:mercuric ion binding protein